MTAKRSSSCDSHLCQFPFAGGRKCRMLRSESHPTLCLFHARQEEQLLESPQLGAELSATLTGNFMTGTDINFVLGKLFTALAQDRLPLRNATTLAYIAQLMLHSLPHIKDEYRFNYKFSSWEKMLDNAITLSDPPSAEVEDEARDDGNDVTSSPEPDSAAESESASVSGADVQ